MMKTVILLAAFVVAATASAQTPAPGKAIAPLAPVGGAKAPSQLKLDPNTLKAIHLAPPPTAADEVDAALANVKTEAERVRTARKGYEDAEKACASRTYSSQDMHDAGCLDTDTVGACTAKLYRLCMRPSQAEYRRRASMFRRAIQVLDQKAQALAFPEAP
jgi:hypothetical protein